MRAFSNRQALLILNGFATDCAYFYGYASGTAASTYIHMQHVTRQMPTCRKCHTGMAFNGITRCAEGYEMWSYNCAGCSGKFKLVEASTARSAWASERRSVSRHRVTTTGTMEFYGGTAPCLIHDVSAMGAGLDLIDRAEVSLHLILIANGSRLPSRVVWRKHRRIGVVFN